MRRIDLKVIPGDGIGAEVIGEGVKILKKIEQIHGGIQFRLDELDWGCNYYLNTHEMMPQDGLKILADCECILLGAIGFPGVPDYISLRGLLLPIRQQFDQYVNLRPIKLLEGFSSPLKISGPKDIDFVIIRENSEGEYCGRGEIRDEGLPGETAIQEAWFSRKGTHRIIKYAFDYAAHHSLDNVVSATKSNALNYSMVFWDRIFDELKPEYEHMNIRAKSIHMDALCGLLIIEPRTFDVIVASNLFGDILTDLGSAMLGSIGISPSANINPERKFPSMFEPSHGSAPDIAGKGIANPIGTVWSVVLMLDHLGLEDVSDLLMSSMSTTIRKRIFTPDLGGRYTTAEVGDNIRQELERLSG